jgi:small subunit ribosomal protein S16
MAVRIRLKRIGRKNLACYRIVVADGHSPRDGRFIEEIGTYDPIKSENQASIKLDRVDYWMKNGAQPTITVKSIIKKAKAVAVAS